MAHKKSAGRKNSQKNLSRGRHAWYSSIIYAVIFVVLFGCITVDGERPVIDLPVTDPPVTDPPVVDPPSDPETSNRDDLERFERMVMAARDLEVSAASEGEEMIGSENKEVVPADEFSASDIEWVERSDIVTQDLYDPYEESTPTLENPSCSKLPTGSRRRF